MTRLASLAAVLLVTACTAGDHPPRPTAPPTVEATGTASPAATPATEATPTIEATPTAEAMTTRTAIVTNIVDGDTIDVRLDGTEHRVRLILIDTPEVHGGVECHGPEASNFVKELLPVGTAVALERDVSDTDRFGRLLRYVYLDDGRMVNELLLEGGYAQVATFPPDVKYVDRFLGLQREARDTGRGLWSECISTAAPADAPVTDGGCAPSYPSVCIPPPPPDLDCGEITFRRFPVVGSDPHGFDGDGDGVGCES